MATVGTSRRSRLSTLTEAIASNILPAALGMFVLWTLVTYLLEGRIDALLRPEATIDRLVYAIVANVLVGTVLAVGVVRVYVTSETVAKERLGFRRPGRTVVAVLGAGILGFALYVVQTPPSLNPVVVTNAYAQVLTVSIAEIVVCWVVVGGAVYAATRSRGELVGIVAAVVGSAIVFGVYHFAHSPPFNTVGMVGLLTVVGLGTGVVYFVVGDVYAALAFHNFMGVFGVTRVLAESGELVAYSEPLYPLLGTALFSLLVLVAADGFLIRRPST